VATTRTTARTYPWADQGGRPDTALLADFKRLIGLRRQHAVLRRGSLAAPLHVDDQVVVQLRRSYVHLSAADQVAGTLAKYFADVPDLILLAVDPAMLGADLRYEPSRGGALFPHLYAPLPLAACQALAWRAQPALPWQAVHPRRDWQTDP
jgi:uncharacterized protein (DUF952 family)